jgi:hypothetical protein
MVDFLMESFGAIAIGRSNGGLDGINSLSVWLFVRIKSGVNSIKNSFTCHYPLVSTVGS